MAAKLQKSAKHAPHLIRTIFGYGSDSVRMLFGYGFDKWGKQGGTHTINSG